MRGLGDVGSSLIAVVRRSRSYVGGIVKLKVGQRKSWDFERNLKLSREVSYGNRDHESRGSPNAS
jgi:hypothetical protein